MLSKLIRIFTAIAAVGLLVLAGCGSGGGGGGGGDNEATGPPTVTGYKYVLTITNSTTEEIEIIRGTASNEWIGTNRQTGDSFWGTYSVLASGIVKMVRTGTTDPEFAGPQVLYAVEVVNGFLFMVTPDDAVGSNGGFGNMMVAFNQEGTCEATTTQGAYNLVKTGQQEWDQTSAAGFGTAAFSTGETGVDLNGSMFTLGMDLSNEPSYGLTVPGMGCTGGIGGGTDNQFAFTATGAGLLRHTDGGIDHDFVALPEPGVDVDGAALMAIGKHYIGIYQGMEDPGTGLQEVTYLVVADGDDSSILADSIVNHDTGEVSGTPGTVILARAGTADRHGMFDESSFTLGTTELAVGAAHSLSGKSVITTVGRFDHDGDANVTDPEDWFFMILVEFESDQP
jgi:hypothetical protein